MTTLTAEQLAAQSSATRRALNAAAAPSVDEINAAQRAMPVCIPFTCGTNHIAAERVLRIIERNFGEPWTEGAIRAMTRLVDEAGFAFAMDAVCNDDVPF